jgi:hypothetical protein
MILHVLWLLVGIIVGIWGTLIICRVLEWMTDEEDEIVCEIEDDDG